MTTGIISMGGRGSGGGKAVPLYRQYRWSSWADSVLGLAVGVHLLDTLKRIHWIVEIAGGPLVLDLGLGTYQGDMVMTLLNECHKIDHLAATLIKHRVLIGLFLYCMHW